MRKLLALSLIVICIAFFGCGNNDRKQQDVVDLGANDLAGKWVNDSYNIYIASWNTVTLNQDGSFRYWHGWSCGSYCGTTIYDYKGKYTVTDNKIKFHSIFATKYTNSSSTRYVSPDQEEVLSKSNQIAYSPADIEYFYTMKLIYGQRAVFFRPADGNPDTNRDLFGLCPNKDTKDEDVTFVGGMFRKVDDIIHSEVIVNQDISTDTIWTSDKIYKIAPSTMCLTGSSPSCDINVTAKLTIEPGTVIKAVKGARLRVTVPAMGNGAGNIEAIGTPDKPIVFQPSDAPDDNWIPEIPWLWNGNATWHGIWMPSYILSSGKEQIKMSYCHIRGAKYGVLAEQGTAQIDHCTFKDNDAGLVVSGETSFLSNGLRANAFSNIFYSNRVPAVITSNMSFDNTNILHGESGQKNEYNAIFVNAYSTMRQNVTWNITEAPYVISRVPNFSGEPDPQYHNYDNIDKLLEPKNEKGRDEGMSDLLIDEKAQLTLGDGVSLQFRVSEPGTCSSSDWEGPSLSIKSESNLVNSEKATFTLFYDEATNSATCWSGIRVDYRSWLSGPNILYAKQHQ